MGSLRSGAKNPMVDDFLILNVVKVKRKNRFKTCIYYSLDNRRLLCMRKAGCTRIRVRVRLAGPSVDEFLNKTRGILGERKEIEVRPRRNDAIVKPARSKPLVIPAWRPSAGK